MNVDASHTVTKEEYDNLLNDYDNLKNDFQRKEKRLDKIMARSDRQTREVKDLNDELQIYKNHLEVIVKDEIKKREVKEKMLLQQSKLAAMGEMIDAIAHQWKQPLNIINMNIGMLGFDFEDGFVTEEYVEELEKKISLQIAHMNSTLNEFRDFFKGNKKIMEFDIKEAIDKVIILMQDELLKNKINVTINDTNDTTFLGVENEFKHLILNLINNSKDAYNENDVQDRNIIIDISSQEDCCIIEFNDNAGGIPLNIIGEIFNANVTSKKSDKGSGIGLYMSAQIAMKSNAQLSVVNIEGGAQFTISQKRLDENESCQI
jgi:C4-dicarboxylate-specific signal transduction histidine kinase